MTDEEWLEMTPRQIHALRKRRLEQMQWQELQTSIIATTFANFSFCRPEQPIPTDHYMLHPLPKSEVKEQKLSGDALMAMVRRLPRQAVKQQ